MPQVGIPIVPKTVLNESLVTHIIIFPWNLADEIAKKIADSLPYSVQMWSAIPELKRIH